MSPSIITTQVLTTEKEQPRLRLMLNGTDKLYGDFRDDLARDGFAVVKGAVPADRAAKYVGDMQEWLESFNMGYKRDDPSTVHVDKMPLINEKGMAMHYGVCHENFVWQIRSEPGVVDAFSKVYATDDLIVSFDAVNVTFPNRTDLPPNRPWAHQDQDPERHGFRCLQGLVNLLPNGANDGGLIVCRGAHLLSEQFHEEFKDEPRIPAWTPEWYGFTDAGMKWLKDHGCEWVKVDAGPGDLLLWDSRAPHYNVSATGSIPRFAVYTCYMPVADASEEDLLRKKAAFEKRLGTTHWPNARHTGNNVAKTRDGKVHGEIRERPLHEPVLSERAFKLTGIPYIAAA